MKRLVLLAALALAACGGVPETVQVSGNGSCHPSQTLPAHKAVAPLNEGLAYDLLTVFNALVDERKTHAADDRDYNTLYGECVGVSGQATAH